jgi:hypothetical protein
LKNKELITPNTALVRAPGFQPQVITGNSEPRNPNWLGELTMGTVFLCRPAKHLTDSGQVKAPRWTETELYVHNNLVKAGKGRSVQLLNNDNNGEKWMWVVALDFSSDFELIDILKEGSTVDEYQQQSDGADDVVGDGESAEERS